MKIHLYIKNAMTVRKYKIENISYKMINTENLMYADYVF